MELDSILQDYIVYSDATESESSALPSPVIPERSPARLKRAAASPIYSSPSTNGSFEDAMSYGYSPGSFTDSIFSDVPTKDPVELDEFGLDLSGIDNIVALLDEIEIATPATDSKIVHSVDARVQVVAISSGIDPIET